MSKHIDTIECVDDYRKLINKEIQDNLSNVDINFMLDSWSWTYNKGAPIGSKTPLVFEDYHSQFEGKKLEQYLNEKVKPLLKEDL